MSSVLKVLGCAALFMVASAQEATTTHPEFTSSHSVPTSLTTSPHVEPAYADPIESNLVEDWWCKKGWYGYGGYGGGGYSITYNQGATIVTVGNVPVVTVTVNGV